MGQGSLALPRSFTRDCGNCGRQGRLRGGMNAPEGTSRAVDQLTPCVGAVTDKSRCTIEPSQKIHGMGDDWFHQRDAVLIERGIHFAPPCVNPGRDASRPSDDGQGVEG